jgi:hypothetical protein
VDENSFGHTWYFFEQELQYPVDMIRFDKVNSVSLDGINTLVIPNGGYRFSEETLEGMKEWVADGGRIIAFDGGAKALADKMALNLEIKPKENPRIRHLLTNKQNATISATNYRVLLLKQY